MHYKKLLIVIFLFVTIACKQENSKNTNTSADADTVVTNNKTAPAQIITDSLTGKYRGEFGSTTIFLSLNYINLDNSSASGYNIVKGNKRNIKGKVEAKDGILYFNLSEPGDDKHDGVFNFTLDPETLVIEGTWTPNDEKITSAKTLKLNKAKPTSPDDEIEGDWYFGYEVIENNERTDYCNGYIKFKKDGTCMLELHKWDDTSDKEINEVVKGSWEKQNNVLTLYTGKSKILKKNKYTLKYTVENEEFGFGYYYGDNITISNSFF
jgi:hypothetical protein